MRASRVRHGVEGTAAVLQLAAEEVEDELGPLDPVPRRARAGQLVALGREAVVLLLLAEQPQRHEQLVGLLDRAAQVVLGVEDQHRRGDVLARR